MNPESRRKSEPTVLDFDFSYVIAQAMESMSFQPMPLNPESRPDTIPTEFSLHLTVTGMDGRSMTLRLTTSEAIQLIAAIQKHLAWIRETPPQDVPNPMKAQPWPFRGL